MTAAVEESVADRLLKGAVDLRREAVSPASYRETALSARAAGMRAVAFMDQGFSPTPAVRMLERAEVLEGIALVSGVVLNAAVGGLNPYAVEHDLKFGGRIVWMPMVSVLNYYRRADAQEGRLSASSQTVIDSRGKLTAAVTEILELIAEHDAVLAFGHLHIAEIWPLHEAALRLGIGRQVLNHLPATLAVPDEDRLALAQAGVSIEYCGGAGGAGLSALVRLVGSERVVLASGPASNRARDPLSGLRDVTNEGLAQGIGEPEMARMLSANPIQLLGI